MNRNNQIKTIKKLISTATDVPIKDVPINDCHQYLLDETCSSFDLMKNFIILNDKEVKDNHDLILDIKDLKQVVQALQYEVATLKPLTFTPQKTFDVSKESQAWFLNVKKFMFKQEKYEILDFLGYKTLITKYQKILQHTQGDEFKKMLKDFFEDFQDFCSNFEMPLKPED